MYGDRQLYLLLKITDTEGEVAVISMFDSLTKIVSKGFRPHRHCLVDFIPKTEEIVINLLLRS